MFAETPDTASTSALSKAIFQSIISQWNCRSPNVISPVYQTTITQVVLETIAEATNPDKSVPLLYLEDHKVVSRPHYLYPTSLQPPICNSTYEQGLGPAIIRPRRPPTPLNMTEHKTRTFNPDSVRSLIPFLQLTLHPALDNSLFRPSCASHHN